MSPPHLQFFQVAATMIVTLLIPIALTQPLGVVRARTMGARLNEAESLWGEVLTLWLPLSAFACAVILGLRACLTALASGQGTERQLTFAVVAIAIELAVVLSRLLSSVLRDYRESAAVFQGQYSFIGWTYLSFIVAGIVACILVALALPV